MLLQLYGCCWLLLTLNVLSLLYTLPLPLSTDVFHAKYVLMHLDHGCLQVQMLWITRVYDQHALDVEAAAHLLFVRYYIVAYDLQWSKEQS